MQINTQNYIVRDFNVNEPFDIKKNGGIQTITISFGVGESFKCKGMKVLLNQLIKFLDKNRPAA